MKFDLDDNKIRNIISKGEFGLEMEQLRITHDGRLSASKHPFRNDPNLTRDFCENQLEIITDVFNSVDEMLSQLSELRHRVSEKLSESGELLWRFSNPPAFSSPDEIPIASFSGSTYRDYLAQKYGKVKMLMSGTHLNFSLPRSAIEKLCKLSGDEDQSEFRNNFYLELAEKLFCYSWLIVYLTAASPVFDPTFSEFGDVPLSERDRYSSLRCSERGYWNSFTPTLDYSSVDTYCDSIERYVNSGEIISCSELYYPIRIKPAGKYSLDSLRQNGINHIELRMLDLNPLSEIGVLREDIEFIHLLILYLISKEPSRLTPEQQLTAVSNMKQAALFDDESPLNICGCDISVKTAASIELHSIAEFAVKYYPQYVNAVRFQLSKLSSPGRRYAEIIRRRFSDNFTEKGLALSWRMSVGNVLSVSTQACSFNKPTRT